MKVFRIIPEFRIFPLKVSIKILNQADYSSFSNYVIAIAWVVRLYLEIILEL